MDVEENPVVSSSVEIEYVNPISSSIEMRDIDPTVSAIEMEYGNAAVSSSIQMEDIDPVVSSNEMEYVDTAVPSNEMEYANSTVPSSIEMGAVNPILISTYTGMRDESPMVPSTTEMEHIDNDTRNTEFEYNELQKRPWYYALTYDSFLPGKLIDLDKKLSLRHVYMITFGGTIGSGLLIASGFALGRGGPGNVLCGFMTIGILIYLTLQGLAELCIMYPNNGSFSSYFSKFVHPAWGY